MHDNVRHATYITLFKVKREGNIRWWIFCMCEVLFIDTIIIFNLRRRLDKLMIHKLLLKFNYLFTFLILIYVQIFLGAKNILAFLLVASIVMSVIRKCCLPNVCRSLPFSDNICIVGCIIPQTTPTDVLSIFFSIFKVLRVMWLLRI